MVGLDDALATVLVIAVFDHVREAMLAAAHLFNGAEWPVQAAAVRAFPAEPWRHFLGSEDERMLNVLDALVIRPKVDFPPLVPARRRRAAPLGKAECGGEPWDNVSSP